MTEDFDGRTALYRQIYSYVMTHSGSQVRWADPFAVTACGLRHPGCSRLVCGTRALRHGHGCCGALAFQGPPDADVQREVAAALESVFPRVGLKAFVSLTPEEKAGQVCNKVVRQSPTCLVRAWRCCRCV